MTPRLTAEQIADVCRTGDRFEPKAGAEASRVILEMAARLRRLEALVARPDQHSERPARDGQDRSDSPLTRG